MIDCTIDMGNYNTIITFRGGPETVHGLLPGVARVVQEFPGCLFIPSLVHLGEDRVSLGEEVLSRELYEDEACFRDLKDHILHPAPVARDVRGLRTTHKKAASIFLSELTRRLHEALGAPVNVVFLFPTMGGELFRECLRYVDLEGARSVTLVDEDTAAALGYGVNLFTDDLLLVFDFGFSAARVRVLQFHWVGREAYTPPVVKASAVLPLGTADLKLKILKELHPDVAGAPLPSFYWKKFSLHRDDPEKISHEKFRDLLEREDLAAQVQGALDRALDEASLGGAGRERITRVLLLGGGTRIPVVRRTLVENFGDLVLGDLPEQAPGRGGIAFLADTAVDDMVRDAYCLRVRDPITGEHHYPVIIERYTRYPTRTPTARCVVNTFYDGQYELHLQVVRAVKADEALGDREILIGDDGKISFVAAGTEDVYEAAMATPIVIPVHPPGRVGERRFLLEFGVDNQKRLVVTTKDLREEKTLWTERPVIDLR